MFLFSSRAMSFKRMLEEWKPLNELALERFRTDLTFDIYLYFRYPSHLHEALSAMMKLM